jgi:hypothetical protein
LIGTLAEFVLEQPETFVTVRFSVTFPVEPAVKVMFCPVALVGVPLTIDHEYVAAPAGPLAAFPVEFAFTLLGAVITGVAGLAFTVTVVADDAALEQPFAVTTTV